ncbi:unnamed protein product, partial [Rotaria magnacalcarata]
GYNFPKHGNFYYCPCSCTFSTTIIKDLLIHIQKCHKKEYKRLIEERKSSLGVLHKVIQELSDDTDNEEDNDYQTETISRNTLNIDRSVRATADDESSMKKNSI